MILSQLYPHSILTTFFLYVKPRSFPPTSSSAILITMFQKDSPSNLYTMSIIFNMGNLMEDCIWEEYVSNMVPEALDVEFKKQ